MSKMTKAQQQERDEAIAKLRELLHPGQIVYTVTRHTARSGMSRSISVAIPAAYPPADGSTPTLEIESLDYWVARALGRRIDRKNGGVICGGAGMDMGFHLVYRLGQELWPDGTPEPHGKRNGQPDRDGGYALKQRWL